MAKRRQTAMDSVRSSKDSLQAPQSSNSKRMHSPGVQKPSKKGSGSMVSGIDAAFDYPKANRQSKQVALNKT